MFRSFSPGFFGFFCFFQSFVLVFGFFSPCLNKASQGFGEKSLMGGSKSANFKSLVDLENLKA